MNDELGDSSQGGRFFADPDDDKPEGRGCTSAIVGCFAMVLLIAIIALSVWLFWPGGDQP